MSFLPVAERELRVAARRRSTFWIRTSAALVALLIGAAFLILSRYYGLGSAVPSLGGTLFAVLTWLILGAALVTGLFFTADCLSEEKREGTLGLLFLTDLRGYDIVLGKLLASSWRGLLALVAAFPILAVTLLMGGLTGIQFWKTCLAILNAMLFSLAGGLFTSVLSRDSQKALAASLGFLLLFLAGGPGADALYSKWTRVPFQPLGSYSSPVYLFLFAGAWGRNPFWMSFLVNQVIVVFLFTATCIVAPHAWQERPDHGRRARARLALRWTGGLGVRRRARRRRLLDLDPIVWLLSSERWQTVLLWIMALIMAGGWLGHFVSSQTSPGWFFWSYLGGLLTLVLYLATASHAARFLVAARRHRLIDLLLVTPLSERQIVQGQWRTILRQFSAPLAVLLAAQLLGVALVQYVTWAQMTMATAAMPVVTTPAATNAPGSTNAALITNATVVSTSTTTGAGVVVTVTGTDRSKTFGYALAAVVALAGTVTVLANLVALIWFGMWMGLTSGNASIATLKTVAFVQVIPWFLISFASALVVPLILLPTLLRGATIVPTRMMLWYPLITTAIATTLALMKDVGFLLWARSRLYTRLRECALPGLPSKHVGKPPPLPALQITQPPAPRPRILRRE